MFMRNLLQSNYFLGYLLLESPENPVGMSSSGVFLLSCTGFVPGNTETGLQMIAQSPT